MGIALTDREADLMRVLWERGASSVAEVRAALEDDLAYTTVLTVLRVLESKGYVGHAEDGRAHRYFAKIEQKAARVNAVNNLLGKLFHNSTELLLTQLVSDHKLNNQQVARVRKLLDKGRPKGK